MLVGLIELLPWLHQYHGEPDEALGGERPAEQYEAFIAEELRQAGRTRQQAEQEVLAWAQGGGTERRKAPAKAAGGTQSRVDGENQREGKSHSPGRPRGASRSEAPKPPSKAKVRRVAPPANDVTADEAPPSSTPASSRRPAPGRGNGAVRKVKGAGR